MTSLMLFLLLVLVLIMLFLVPKVGLLCLPFHLHLLGAYLWGRLARVLGYFGYSIKSFD